MAGVDGVDGVAEGLDIWFCPPEIVRLVVDGLLFVKLVADGIDCALTEETSVRWVADETSPAGDVGKEEASVVAVSTFVDGR